MKKLIIMSAIAMSGLIYQTASAQIGVRFNVNLGARPVYVEPAPLYNDADYYYLPDVEAYYSVNNHCYYYQDGVNWVSAAYLPGRYHDYDWQHARRYEIHGDRPFMHNDVYRARYGGIEGQRDWGRDDRRVYANRDQQYRGGDYGRNQQYGDRSHADGGYYRQQNDNHVDRGNYGRNDAGYNRQQNDNHFDRGNNGQQHDDHSYRQDNNGRGDHQQGENHQERGNNDRGHDGGQDRRGRF